MQKFLQKGWAAQGFKAKKRIKAEPADKKQLLGNSRIPTITKNTKQENGIFTILK
ncbi:MAG: hypothetical protein SO164_01130 [Campylobacter sp.]|nr:hypothetical protein [Campylobacter sp.]